MDSVPRRPASEPGTGTLEEEARRLDRLRVSRPKLEADQPLLFGEAQIQDHAFFTTLPVSLEVRVRARIGEVQH